jgi:recombination protein RecT
MPAQQRQRPGTQVARRGTHQEVAERGGMGKFLAYYTPTIASVLPSHINPGEFMGLAGAALRRDPKLKEAAEANPHSLMIALRECAALGHVPIRGTYALVPFNRNRDKVPEGVEVVGIEEVGGVIERMYRAGAVKAVHAEVVRERDAFARQPMGLPLHEFDPLEDPAKRGPLRGVYAWADLGGGVLSQVVIMSAVEVAKHRAVSRSGDAFWGPSDSEGPWTQDMWKKTALHKLEKVVPTTREWRTMTIHAEAAAASQRQQGATAETLTTQPLTQPDYVDAEEEPPGGWPDTAQPGGGAPQGGQQ